jgi:hypothetical protein
MLRILIAATLLATPALAADGPSVSLLKTPDSGTQPQAVTDDKGTIHLIYFRGEAGAGDLFYVNKPANADGFSKPIRINTVPGSAIAMGTIRGGQIALGKNGRVHVAWNGSDKARPRNAFGSTPMLYTRSNSERTRFEPERNVMKRTSMLDGGGSIAADLAGNVYVNWHGKTESAEETETGRQLFVTKSADDGATFADESPAIDLATGACGCCGTKSLADHQGNLFILFRAAGEKVNRDLFLVSSRDAGKQFQGSSVHPWKIESCTMSSESLAESKGEVVAAWETKGHVYFARVDPVTGKTSTPIAPPVGSGQKHPAVAINAKGEVLLAWAEGTGWQRGGDLAWQVFDKNGKPIGAPGHVEKGVPVWSLPAVVAQPDGSFVIVH